MTIHVLGLPHTAPTKEWSHCAFTDRTRVFAAMVPGTILYSSTAEERARWWPDYDATEVFNDFDPNSLGWRESNARFAAEIRERAQPGDILAVTMGLAQKPCADALSDLGLLVVETGIGYSGVFAPYRVFESRPWQSFLAAREPTDDVRFYDAVIPRAWDVADFPLGKGDGGYYLFVGRLMARKGPHIAAEACKRIGARLLVAGQGVAETGPGYIIATDGTRIEGDVEYVGVVGPEERAKLMGGAIALFAPTTYFEPLGGVAIEAMLTGTPAITTDYGAFTETVDANLRCSTLAEFASTARNAPHFDRQRIRARAVGRYSTKAVARRFETYFAKLATLHGDGWYAG